MFTATDSDPNRIPCQSPARQSGGKLCLYVPGGSLFSEVTCSPLPYQSLPLTPQLRKDVLLEGALTLIAAGGVVGFHPVPCHLRSQTFGTCPQAAIWEQPRVPTCPVRR